MLEPECSPGCDCDGPGVVAESADALGLVCWRMDGIGQVEDKQSPRSQRERRRCNYV